MRAAENSVYNRAYKKNLQQAMQSHEKKAELVGNRIPYGEPISQAAELLAIAQQARHQAIEEMAKPATHRLVFAFRLPARLFFEALFQNSHDAGLFEEKLMRNAIEAIALHGPEDMLTAEFCLAAREKNTLFGSRTLYPDVPDNFDKASKALAESIEDEFWDIAKAYLEAIGVPGQVASLVSPSFGASLRPAILQAALTPLQCAPCALPVASDLDELAKLAKISAAILLPGDGPDSAFAQTDVSRFIERAAEVCRRGAEEFETTGAVSDALGQLGL